MHTTLTKSRRQFLSALGASALALPAITLPSFVRAAGDLAFAGNVLVLIELSGGNDGLNTVVPTRDPAYRALRPSIGLVPRDTLTLDGQTGLHPAMGAMAHMWEAGELQIIEGVGYPNPNRSHFRSIEIWNAGLGAESDAQTGWISRAFADSAAPGARDAEGLVIGGDMGPLRGPGRFSSLRDEERFLETLSLLQRAPHAVRARQGSPLDHVLSTYESAQITGEAVRRRLASSPARGLDFPDSDIGAQLRTVARLLEAGVEVSVLKVTQDGYDTHDAQPGTHAFLLEDLSDAIGAFARAMRQIGLWQQVTVVTYSEFGRTARENASDGTDHGTAAPIFVAGGRVQGGLSGQRVDLDRLQDGDLVHTTDYRDVYAALVSELWGASTEPFRRPNAAALSLLRGA